MVRTLVKLGADPKSASHDKVSNCVSLSLTNKYIDQHVHTCFSLTVIYM